MAPTTKEEATAWVKKQVTEIGFGWNPENDYADYVCNDGQPMVAPEIAVVMNAELAAAWELLGDEIYDVALDLIHSIYDTPAGT